MDVRTRLSEKVFNHLMKVARTKADYVARSKKTTKIFNKYEDKIKVWCLSWSTWLMWNSWIYWTWTSIDTHRTFVLDSRPFVYFKSLSLSLPFRSPVAMVTTFVVKVTVAESRERSNVVTTNRSNRPHLATALVGPHSQTQTDKNVTGRSVAST